MRMRWLMLLMLLPLFRIGAPSVAQAAEAATWQGEIKDIPTWITVVPRGHDIPAQVRASAPWWQWGNATTDAYLFAFGTANNLRVILDFQTTTDGRPIARLYVDDFGRKRLDYTLNGERLQVNSAGGHAYLTLRPREGGWLIGDKTNYNLEIDLDGYLPGLGNHDAPTDGATDVQIRVGGAQPGVADWATSTLLIDPHPTWGYPRFGAAQRMAGAPPFKTAPPMMPIFPIFDIGLGTAGQASGQLEDDINWLRENPNPLYYNVRFSQLQLFSFPGFQHGGMYNVNSLSVPENVDFESPFAFYNFDQRSRQAHLVVRGGYFPVDGPMGGESNVDRTSFRYSWKLADDSNWSYSVHVAGTYAYTQEVTIGDLTIHSIPAAELPHWVVDKPWPVVTFVEATKGFISSEGIYFYTAQSNKLWPWIDGTANTPPSFLDQPRLQFNNDVTEGSDVSLPPDFRGEYSAMKLHKPDMYLSAIDNRLHLLGAEGGVWNLGGGSMLRVHNLDGDDYIDGWTREQVLLAPTATDTVAAPGAVQESLYAIDGYMIYSGPQGAQLRKASVAPGSAAKTPPTDQASWLTFREQMQPIIGQERDPANLRGWLGAIAGAALLETRGQISNVRTMSNGFRFEVVLQSGFQASDTAIPGARDLVPGSFVVIYDGAFHIEPLTPPALAIQVAPGGLLREPGIEVRPNELRVRVANSGLEDAHQLLVSAEATDETGETLIIGQQEITAFSGQATPVNFAWMPPQAGAWHLRVAVSNSSASGDNMPVLAQYEQQVQIAPPEQPTLTQTASTFGLIPIPALLLLLGTVLSMAVLVLRFMQYIPARRAARANTEIER